MILKELLRPTLSPQSIVVRKDDENKSHLRELVGYRYPLLRILDTTIDAPLIQNFSLTIGNTFLPTMDITVDDTDQRFREKLKANLDILTLYMGSNRDNNYIKSDYLIGNLYSDPSSTMFTLSCMLLVKDLYTKRIRSFGKTTSIEVLKTICAECGLGLLSNVDSTTDEQVYIQDGKRTVDYIFYICKRAYKNDNTKFDVFIDQYNYLNFIDVASAYSDNTPVYTTEDPISGEQLDEKRAFILNNNIEDPDKIFKFTQWSTDNNYGAVSQNTPQILRTHSVDIELNKKEEAPIKETFISTKTNDDKNAKFKNAQLLDYSYVQLHNTDNTHANYSKTLAVTEQLDKVYGQGSKLDVGLMYPVFYAFPYQYVPVELYNSVKHEQYDEQENTGRSVEDIMQNIANPSAKYEKNTLISGDYWIRSITYSYAKSHVTWQRIRLHQLPSIKD
jgi:hypothetical protein